VVSSTFEVAVVAFAGAAPERRCVPQYGQATQLKLSSWLHCVQTSFN